MNTDNRKRQSDKALPVAAGIFDTSHRIGWQSKIEARSALFLSRITAPRFTIHNSIFTINSVQRIHH